VPYTLQNNTTQPNSGFNDLPTTFFQKLKKEKENWAINKSNGKKCMINLKPSCSKPHT